MDSPINSSTGLTLAGFEPAGGRLLWNAEAGMGYVEPRAALTEVYDAAYFEAYRERADTPIGRALTEARVDMVARWHYGPMIDVGIGSGQFVEARPGTWGFDVNPAGVRWLEERGQFWSLYERRYRAASFWDALEHIPDPAAAIAQVERYAFVSLPVFENAAHCLKSKHYKPDEHIWYWTADGFKAWMAAQGFSCVEESDIESCIGREGISSFVFRRDGR